MIFLFFSAACSSSFVREKDVKAFNQKILGKEYITRKTIYSVFPNGGQAPPTKVFAKGTRVHITAEQGDEWIRVRAFPAKSNREQAQGKVVLFIVRGLWKEKKGHKTAEQYSIEELSKELAEILKESPSKRR